MKNVCLKTRPVTRPYEVWVAGDWTWKVLKKYQADDRKPYARWFCVVTSPMSLESGDMGDVFASEVMRMARRVKVDYFDV